MDNPPKGTFGQWCVNVVLDVFIAGLGLLPFETRGNLVAKLFRGPLGRLSGYRKRVTKNLEHVYGDALSDHKKRMIEDEVLENAGRTFFENLFPADFQKHAKVTHFFGEGMDALLKARDTGQGVVLASGHFGNHEALRLALHDLDIKVGGLYRPMSNPYFNKRYFDAIQICGRTGPLYPVGRDGTHAFVKGLSKGEFSVLLIDLAISSGEEIEFLGKPAMTSTAAAAFAIKTGALYLPYFTLRHADGSGHSVEICAPIDGDDPLQMTKDATRLLENQIEQTPGNWFWVHRRWKLWV